MLHQTPQQIPEWRDVDERGSGRKSSRDTGQPCCAAWSGTGRRCSRRESPANVSRYLVAFDNGSPVDAILMPPQARGRISYNDAMDGFNFVRNRLSVSAIVEQLSRYALFEDPPAVAVQSALISACLPGFTVENRLAILDPAVAPRIWIGNRVTVPAHFDESQNVACVVAGRRRFTLFPPEQVANLYIGPLDYAPTGAAMSMVNFRRRISGNFPDSRMHSRRRSSRTSGPAMRSSFPPCGGTTWSRSIGNSMSSSIIGGTARSGPSTGRHRQWIAFCTAC